MAFLSHWDNFSSSLDVHEDLYHFSTRAAPGIDGFSPPPPSSPLQSAGTDEWASCSHLQFTLTWPRDHEKFLSLTHPSWCCRPPSRPGLPSSFDILLESEITFENSTKMENFNDFCSRTCSAVGQRDRPCVLYCSTAAGRQFRVLLMFGGWCMWAAETDGSRSGLCWLVPIEPFMLDNPSKRI